MASKLKVVKQFYMRTKYRYQWSDWLLQASLVNDTNLSKQIVIYKQQTCLPKYRNQCILTNRSSAVFKSIRLTRMAFKNLASHGLLNGISKASW